MLPVAAPSQGKVHPSLFSGECVIMLETQVAYVMSIADSPASAAPEQQAADAAELEVWMDG